MKLPKEKTLKQYQKELDKIFSIFIRLRNADANGMVQCFTSGKIMHWRESQAGHFVSRRHLATRWDEINVQVQSVKENVFNQGNAPEFSKRLAEKYGQKAVDLLLIKKHNKCKMGKFEYQILISDYKKKVEGLKKYLKVN